MAKKKKRARPRPSPGAQTAAPRGDAARGGANVQRRERKEEARRLREAERRRSRRASALRRTVTSIGIAALAVGGIAFLQSIGGPNEIPGTAVRAAERAGCTEVDQPATSAPSGQHLQPGQTHQYADSPATSGLHDPSPLPTEPKVYETQPPETRVVHSLEHGAVFVHYLPEADGGLPQDIVDRLARVAEGGGATFLAPYPGLTPETALTLTAWNRRQSCPVPEGGAALTSASAATIVNGFVTAFECTSNAPENGASPC
jgi:hypothetical protein